jgi:hypothetical protein
MRNLEPRKTWGRKQCIFGIRPVDRRSKIQTNQHLLSTQHFLCRPCQHGEAKGLDRQLLLSLSPAYHGMQADKACDYSGVSNFAVVAVEYTRAVIHILRVDRDNKGTGYTDGSLTVTIVSWDASRQGLRFSGLTGTTKGLDTLLIPSPSPAYRAVSNFAVGVEYTHLAAFPIFHVDSGDKGTGYAADCLIVTRVSGGLVFCGGGGIYSSGCISHPPG